MAQSRVSRRARCLVAEQFRCETLRPSDDVDRLVVANNIERVGENPVAGLNPAMRCKWNRHTKDQRCRDALPVKYIQHRNTTDKALVLHRNEASGSAKVGGDMRQLLVVRPRSHGFCAGKIFEHVGERSAPKVGTGPAQEPQARRRPAQSSLGKSIVDEARSRWNEGLVSKRCSISGGFDQIASGKLSKVSVGRTA